MEKQEVTFSGFMRDIAGSAGSSESVPPSTTAYGSSRAGMMRMGAPSKTFDPIALIEKIKDAVANFFADIRDFFANLLCLGDRTVEHKPTAHVLQYEEENDSYREFRRSPDQVHNAAAGAISSATFDTRSESAPTGQGRAAGTAPAQDAEAKRKAAARAYAERFGRPSVGGPQKK